MIARLDLESLMATDRGSIQRHLDDVRALIRDLKQVEATYMRILRMSDARFPGQVAKRMTMAEGILVVLRDAPGQQFTAEEIANEMRHRELFVRGEMQEQPVYQALQRPVRQHEQEGAEPPAWRKAVERGRGIVWWVESSAELPAELPAEISEGSSSGRS